MDSASSKSYLRPGAASGIRRYGLAILACSIAPAIALPLDAPVSCFVLAVIVTGLYGGKGPGLLAVALSALAFDYFFLPPRFHLGVDPPSYLRFAVFLVALLLIVALLDAKRRVEESRRKADARYWSITDTAPDAILSVDGSGRVSFANPATEVIFGWAPPELIGQSLSLLLRDFTTADMHQSNAEWTGIRKGGTEFFAEVSMGPVPGFDGIEYAGFVRDITRRKRAETALQKSESYLAEAQKLSKTGSFGWNTATGELFWSSETFRIAQMDSAVKPSLETLAERIHPADRVRIKDLLDRGAGTGEDLDFEHRFLLPDGSVTHVHVRAHAARMASGAFEYVGSVMDITSRVLAEDALRRSEAYLTEAQALSHTGSWVWDARTPGPVYWSAEMYQIYRRDPSQGPASAEEDAALHSPDDWKRLMAAAEQSIRDGSRIDFETRLLFPDGVVKHVRKVAHPASNAAGELVQFVGTTIDVTEQHQARAALQNALAEVQESEDRLRMIINTIPALAWSARPDGSVDFYNQRWLDYTGLSAQRALHYGWTSTIHPDDLPALTVYWQSILASGQPGETEARVRRFDGVYRWFLFRSSPLRNRSGEIVAWYGTNTDIEDRKNAEEALRANERNLALIIETIPALVWCAAPDGEITYVNQRILDYTGRALPSLRDSGPPDVGPPNVGPRDLGWARSLHPDDVLFTVRAWSEAVATSRPYEIQYRLRRADGVYRWFHALAQPARDREGRTIRWYGLLIDIDDRKNMEEALRRTQTRLSRAMQIATVGELAASIAHEINQPLAAVVANGHACLRWLQAQPPNLLKAHEAAERIVRDGKDAGQVIQRVRALFRRDILERVAVDLNEMIAEVLRLFRAEAARKRICLETDLEQGLPPVIGDPVQFQQLLFNLLVNGIEAMEPVSDRPRKLTIRSKRLPPAAILVEIQDTGIGLEEPHKVFEAFFTTKEKGMGMGLAICRSIIEAHNGRLWADSAQECGAIFSFTLPAAPESPQETLVK